MNSFFPNPFLSLQGDGQSAPHNNMQCNFGTLPRSYDQQSGPGQPYGPASQPMTGHYPSASPPSNGHGPSDPTSCARHQDMNGYDTPAGPMSSAMPPTWAYQGGGHQMTSDYGQTVPSMTDGGAFNTCPMNMTSPAYSNHVGGGQHLPIYPWMSVVGGYFSLCLQLYYCRRVIAVCSSWM